MYGCGGGGAYYTNKQKVRLGGYAVYDNPGHSIGKFTPIENAPLSRVFERKMAVFAVVHFHAPKKNGKGGVKFAQYL